MNAIWHVLEISYGYVYNYQLFEEERIYHLTKTLFARPGSIEESQWPIAKEGCEYECDYPKVKVFFESVSPKGVTLKVEGRNYEFRQKNDYQTLFGEEGVFNTYLIVRARLM